MTEELEFYELDQIVRENSDRYRLYESEQIERMRKDLAKCGLRLSFLEAELKNTAGRADRIEALLSEMREARAYEWADKLREAMK